MQLVVKCVVAMATAAEAGESSQWVKRTSLVDSRTSVTDVKFASKHQGLQLVGHVTGHVTGHSRGVSTRW